MLRAVGLTASVCLAAAAPAPIRALVRAPVRCTVPPALVFGLAPLFAAGLLLAAFAFATAGFFAFALLPAASTPAPVAIRTAGQSSRPNNPIARNPALVLNNLTPKATPTLHRPNRL
jgi:hypothetical protein